MFMRYSKFKHVFGKPNKKETCYDAIRITKSSWDSTFCAVNPKFVAVITEAAGGGSFLVIPIEMTGRIDPNTPLVAGHRANVLDIQWCPFDDHRIASASEDCTVKVWTIPEGGLLPETNLTEPTANLVAHQRRVGLVLWHPTANDVLVSSGADNMVYIWNVATQSVLVEMSFPEMILHVNFNSSGSKLVCSAKDKKIRVVNPRTGVTLTEGVCHEGFKPQQVVYLKDDMIFTTGFSRMGERQLGLWRDDNLEQAIAVVDVDTENAVAIPYYDSDTGLIFVSGKGESTIRFYEVSGEEPYIHFLNSYLSSDPLRGWGFMPKRGLDVTTNEIARCYKLHTRGLCEVIPFTVPRKSELYQDDLYPPCSAGVSQLSAMEWFAGKDAEPILMSLKDHEVVSSSDVSPTPVHSYPEPSVKNVTSPTQHAPEVHTQHHSPQPAMPYPDPIQTSAVTAHSGSEDHWPLVHLKHVETEAGEHDVQVLGQTPDVPSSSPDPNEARLLHRLASLEQTVAHLCSRIQKLENQQESTPLAPSSTAQPATNGSLPVKQVSIEPAVVSTNESVPPTSAEPSRSRVKQLPKEKEEVGLLTAIDKFIARQPEEDDAVNANDDDDESWE